MIRNAIKEIVSGKDPVSVYKDMLKNDVKFREFVEKHKGDAIKDIALEYDIDLSNMLSCSLK